MERYIAVACATVFLILFLQAQPTSTTTYLPTTTTTRPMQEMTLDQLFQSFPQTTLPEKECDIANCNLNGEDFNVPLPAQAEADAMSPKTLEEAYFATRSIDKKYHLSCGKSSLILMELMEDVECDYKVYHIINMLTESEGHSFVGIEKDGRYLILDPLNCGEPDMLWCVNVTTTNFYANQGITRKDKVIAYQQHPYACRYTI